MANSCMVSYRCVGNEKDIASLHDALKRVEEKDRYMALYDLVKEIGGDADAMPCRGEIILFSLEDDGSLAIEQDTAWCEQEDVRHLIEEVYESVRVYYKAEEPGFGVYLTNDDEGRFFSERYFLDSNQEDDDYFATIEEAAKYVSNIVGCEVEPTFETVEAAIESYVNIHKGKDMFYRFHEFEIYY